MQKTILEIKPFETGRGFAVVADEVSVNLQKKIMSATSEVSNSIGAILRVVEENIKSMETIFKRIWEACDLPENSGSVLQEIVSESQRKQQTTLANLQWHLSLLRNR